MSTTIQTLSDVISDVIINATKAAAGDVTVNETILDVITNNNTAADVISTATIIPVISSTTEAVNKSLERVWWNQELYGIHGTNEFCTKWYSNLPGDLVQINYKIFINYCFHSFALVIVTNKVYFAQIY